MTWVQRLKHVFHIDIETCSACGGTVKIIASIEDPAVINQIQPNPSICLLFPTRERYGRFRPGCGNGHKTDVGSGRDQSRALNYGPDCTVIWLKTR
jgi:hypothetical protein